MRRRAGGRRVGHARRPAARHRLRPERRGPVARRRPTTEDTAGRWDPADAGLVPAAGEGGEARHVRPGRPGRGAGGGPGGRTVRVTVKFQRETRPELNRWIATFEARRGQGPAFARTILGELIRTLERHAGPPPEAEREVGVSPPT